MSQTRRISRIAAAIAAGVLSLVCAVPTSAVVSTTNADNSSVQGTRNGGGGWCC